MDPTRPRARRIALVLAWIIPAALMVSFVSRSTIESDTIGFIASAVLIVAAVGLSLTVIRSSRHSRPCSLLSAAWRCGQGYGSYSAPTSRQPE